jgi:hypothetical protein
LWVDDDRRRRSLRRLETLGRGDEAKRCAIDGLAGRRSSMLLLLWLLLVLKVLLVGEEEAPALATRGYRCCCPREALVDLNSAQKIEAKLRAEL